MRALPRSTPIWPSCPERNCHLTRKGALTGALF